MAHRLNFFKYFVISFFLLTVSVFLGFDTAQAQIQDCPLTITKSANPADNSPFVILLTGNTIIPQIVLQDPDDPTNVINVPSETAGVRLTEDVPPGWELVDIICEGEQGFSFNFVGNNTVVASCEVIGNAPPSGQCTFRNALAVSNVPTMSQWTMIAFAGLLGLVGLIVYRRRLLAS